LPDALSLHHQSITTTIQIIHSHTKTIIIMKSLRNSVQLIGNLGTAPEVKNFDNGKSIAKFSVATNESYYNQKGEKVQETQWHNVVAWGKTAEIAGKYLSKGQEIAIEGKLTTRSWDDKAGVKHYITEIVANELVLLGKKQTN
jgi:single-strand DNA-binding protein